MNRRSSGVSEKGINRGVLEGRLLEIPKIEEMREKDTRDKIVGKIVEGLGLKRNTNYTIIYYSNELGFKEIRGYPSNWLAVDDFAGGGGFDISGDVSINEKREIIGSLEHGKYIRYHEMVEIKANDKVYTFDAKGNLVHVK